VTPAGAIPFESHLTTIDMLGLTDPWTARHGVELPYEVLPKAGHEHIPDDASMVEVPVDDERVLMVLYLEPDDDVERLLAEGTWREVELDMGQP